MAGEVTCCCIARVRNALHTVGGAGSQRRCRGRSRTRGGGHGDLSSIGRSKRRGDRAPASGADLRLRRRRSTGAESLRAKPRTRARDRASGTTRRVRAHAWGGCLGGRRRGRSVASDYPLACGVSRRWRQARRSDGALVDGKRGSRGGQRIRLSGALRAFRAFEMRAELLECLEDYSVLARLDGALVDAVRLCGATARSRQRRGLVRQPTAERRWLGELATLRQRLGDRAFDEAWSQGQAWTSMTWFARFSSDRAAIHRELPAALAATFCRPDRVGPHAGRTGVGRDVRYSRTNPSRFGQLRSYAAISESSRSAALSIR